MIRSLFTAAAAAVALSGVALAQSLPPPTVLTPAPSAPVTAPDTTTSIRTNIGPDGSVHATATQKGIDANGQEVTEKHSYRNGPEGTEETHSTTRVDPVTGDSETRSTTTDH
jgi:hypothetical protein